MPREELVEARANARATLEARLGHRLTDPEPCGMVGLPRQPFDFERGIAERIADTPRRGDVIVIDHGDKVTLTRVRRADDRFVVTESAHVTGSPWERSRGLAVSLYRTDPKNSTRLNWRRYVLALAARDKSNALIDVTEGSRHTEEEPADAR